MDTALISLLASIVGGTLVVLGQILARRLDDHRHWQTLLHIAAAEVATSYEQERARLTLDRRQGKSTPTSAEAAYVVGRQTALGRLRTLPNGDKFEAEIDEMGAAIERLWGAWNHPDHAWLDARAAVAVAIERFSTKVREQVSTT